MKSLKLTSKTNKFMLNKCMKALIFICSLSAANISIAQNRVERPLQFQLNLSGLFLDLAGNGLADPTVDELNVNSWFPGISLGNHFNRYIYLGYSLYAPLNMTLKESWGLTHRALDANISLKHRTGMIHNLETRISPFKFGLYASLSYANVGEVDYRMQFIRKGDQVLIGNNSYDTDLDIKWNSKNISTAAIGIGYTYVAQSGISFNLGLNVPMRFPNSENIRISTVDAAVIILPSDIALAEKQIMEETFYGPVVMYLNVGYNLQKFWKKK